MQLFSFRTTLRHLLLAVALMPLRGCQKSETSDSKPIFTSKNFSKTEEIADLNTRIERIDRVLDHTLNQRRLNTKDHAAWQIVHALLAFGNDLQIEHEGQLVPALQWLLDGNTLTGWNLRPGDRGIVVPVEIGSKTGQGHPDQWLGYLSQTGLDPNKKIVVGGKDYTIKDLLTQALWDLTPGMEATWTLMAVGNPNYWNLNDPWKSRNGETWTVERLAGMEGNEASAIIVGGSCGGTHRLYALAMAVNQKLSTLDKKNPEPLSEDWARADATVQKYKNLCRDKFQNRDGTFSGHYFTRPGMVADISDQVGTTGHIFEFLVAAMRPAELREPWMVAACDRLLTLMEQARDVSLDCGGLYHAAHGLILYRERLVVYRDELLNGAKGE
jgi:hypothetical protein